MRTAITLALGHDGKWKLLSNPDESLIKQKKKFLGLRGAGAHVDFARIVYQESDGHSEVLYLLTPNKKKKQDDQHAAELDEARKTAAANAEKDPRASRDQANEKFAAATKQAEEDEAYAVKHKLHIHEIAAHRAGKLTAVENQEPELVTEN